MHHATLLRVSALLAAFGTSACLPESVCEDGPADLTFSIDQVPIEVKPGTELVLTGTLHSEARIEQLLIGGTSAKGTSANFETWEVKIPSVRFDGVQGIWKLETKVSTCGEAPTLIDTQDVFVSVPDLAVTLTGDQDACYIGANGAGAAIIELAAGESFAGARVTLAAPDGTQVIPGTTTYLDTGGASDSSSLISTGKLDAAVSVTATAGTRSFAARPIIIAGPPLFDAEPKAVSNGVNVPLFVRTRGRFASCSADLPVSGSAVLTLPGEDAPLSGTPTAIDEEGCGQVLVIRATFSAGTPSGTTMVLSCSDTYGQTTTRVLSSSGDPG
ncbi:MAG: hypothetical protein IPM79_28095 [Polyangiaceae bacterium]|nr:hypothetical protein [Polyangiaceae bacterium]MBK8941364.1 hypothetical protein [Polyangiaceae bacterium]